MLNKIIDFWFINFSGLFPAFDIKLQEYIYKKEWRKLIKEVKKDLTDCGY